MQSPLDPRSGLLHSGSPRFRIHWAPVALLALLGVVIAVNIGFVVAAKHSWTGLVSDRAFVQGNDHDHNRTLAQARAQAALGWKGGLELRDGVLRFTLTGAGGSPIGGMTVTAGVERPVEPLPAIELPLTEQPGGQGYATPLALPRHGQWLVHVTARHEGRVFRHSQRIFLP